MGLGWCMYVAIIARDDEPRHEIVFVVVGDELEEVCTSIDRGLLAEFDGVLVEGIGHHASEGLFHNVKTDW